MEFHRGSNYNRYSVSHNNCRDQAVKTTEAMHCNNQSIVATNSVDAGILEGNSASCGNGCPTSGTKTRKRKSRWDQPAETNTDVRSPQQKLQKSDPYPQPAVGEVLLYHKNGLNGEDKQCSDYMHVVSQKMNANGADVGEQSHDEDAPPGFLLPLNGPTDGEQSVDEDAPPGFSLPLNGSSSVIDIHRESSTPARCPDEVVMGHPRERFINRSAVSYGIPLPVVQQFGIPQGETLERWIVGPGVPFLPFPPLPSYPRAKREPPAYAGNSVAMNRRPAICHSDQNTPSTSGARPPEVVTQSANNQHIFQQVQGSCNLGRRYFRQQKWNNSTLRPPWIRSRNAWGFMGNNSRNGICSTGVATVSNEIRGPTNSDVSAGMVSSCNTFYQYPQQQNLH